MIYNGKEVAFPAKMHLSFSKVISSLEEMSKDPNVGKSAYASELLKEVEAYPELKEGITDVNKLEELKEPIQKISHILFPDALTTNEIKALTPPFYFTPLRTSKRFDQVIKASGNPFDFTFKDVDEDTFYMYGCYYILGSYYGYPVTSGGSLKLEIENKEQGLTRIYKLLINADHSDFTPTENAIDISREDYEELIDNFGNIDLWKEKFPPDSWIMRGVSIINLVDVTIDESINAITSNLLVKSDGAFDRIQMGIRMLLSNANISLGVLIYEDGAFQTIGKHDIRSILLDIDDSLNCSKGMCDYAYGQLIRNKEPLVIPDVEKFHSRSMSQLSSILINESLGSYLVMPLVHEDELLGFMELASANRYDLNMAILKPLNEIIPIIAMAQKRFKDEAQNRIEAIIQQECTTIHPSVKWRFEEEAEKFMAKELNKEQPVFKDIIFNNLYPLYGQVDIKGSSSKRNKAVSADLIKQLSAVEKVIKAAFQKTKMPYYEALIFRLEELKADLKVELSAGSEHKILGYLKETVYPVFDHLKETDRAFKELIKNYNDLLDPVLNTIYEERKKYDTSVNHINQRLASLLDKRQTEAQAMYPHYFERYKTDGVEYNLYIGQSITKSDSFNPVYLRNLRIWQLLIMCELENEFHQMKDELPTMIEVASLILVYNTSLSVHFRMDEKRFDVEGAYNARYEIIKKRVDKANIKGTQERITKPGHLVIVYSQEQDAKEYREYLHYLGELNHIHKEYEDVELEDLQGVTGLRALRVGINLGGTTSSVDKLIEAIESGERG